MKCPNCGQEIQRGWQYCPKCGSRFRRSLGLFGNLFSRMDRDLREIESMNKRIDKQFEALDLSPFFRQMQVRPRGSGFTIRIRRAGDAPPRVSVRTFGNVNREQVRSQLGMQGRLKPVERPAKPMTHKVSIKPPKSVEEPKADVRRTGSALAVDLKIPGVKSPKDINIRELENSVEVRASAGDKAYFKILTKPPQFRISRKSLSKGKLHLEFS